MFQVRKIVQGAFFPEVSSRRQRLGALVAVSLMQSGLTALLFSTTSPLRALGLAIAIPGATLVLLSPHLGMYVLAASLIGQWPWGIMRYLILSVAASGLVWRMLHRKPVFPPNAILILASLFLLFVLASSINPLTRIELLPSVLAYVGHFTVVWIFVTMVDSRQAVRRVVQLMVMSGVVTAIIGLIQFRTHFLWVASTTAKAMTLEISRGKTAMELQGRAESFRIDSITGTPDFFPLYLQTLIPFVCFWLVRQPSRARQVVGLLVLLLFGVTHVLSFTRGALVTTAIVLVMVGWIVDKRRLVVFGPALMLVGCVAFISWEPTREVVLSIIFSDHSLQKEVGLDTGEWRLRILPVAVEMLFQRPILGMGISQHQYNWPPSARNLIVVEVADLSPIHNSYLSVGIEVGLGGLAVLLTLMVTTIRRLQWLGRRFHEIGEPELADAAQASLIAFIGLAFAMLIYPIVDVFRYFWLLLGLAGALVRLEDMLHSASSEAVRK